MKVLSLKLKDEIFEDVEEFVKANDVSRNAYINQAVDFYNRLMKRKSLKQQILKESRAVYGSSMRVLKEFEDFEDDLPS